MLPLQGLGVLAEMAMERGVDLVADRCDPDVGKPAPFEDLAIARSGVGIRLRYGESRGDNPRGCALLEPFRAAGGRQRDDVRHREASAGAQHPEGLPEESLARVEVESAP
jgi:hypothetical protein